MNEADLYDPAHGSVARPEAGSDLARAIRERTPARLLVGRAGLSYRTPTHLDLRLDHAYARDAVRRELDLARDLGPACVEQWGIFEVSTLAASKEEYLLRPDLGRLLGAGAREAIRSNCPPKADLQVIIADGLSVDAVAAQVPGLLPQVEAQARLRGWSFGRPFVVRHGRVGILNEVGDVLDPAVAVLLIGERPGLATSESLSAYMAHRPRPGDTDARRNLISNIHARGVSIEQAAFRIARLADDIRARGDSGVALKESFDAPSLGGPA